MENLSCFTVKEKNKISSCTLMNMEDIVEDIKELDCQECCVTSIQSLKAKSDLQGVAGGKRKRKRKKGSSNAEESMVGNLVAQRATVIRLQQRVFAMCLETEDQKVAVAKAMAARAVSESEIVEVEGACCCAERVMKVKDPYDFVWQFCSPSNKCGANMEA